MVIMVTLINIEIQSSNLESYFKYQNTKRTLYKNRFLKYANIKYLETC